MFATDIESCALGTEASSENDVLAEANKNIDKNRATDKCLPLNALIPGKYKIVLYLLDTV